MAYATISVPGDGTTTLVTVSFPLGWIDATDVRVRVSGEVDGTGAPVYRTYTRLSASLYQISGAAAAVGENYIFERRVDKEHLIVDWEDGDAITEENLNKAQKQAIMIGHEALDLAERAVKVPEGQAGYTISGDIPDGATLMISGDVISEGPNAADIQDAQSYAEQAYASKIAAEAALADAEEAAATLPPISPTGGMIVDSADGLTRETKTFSEVFNLVVQDGSVDNTKLADAPALSLKGNPTSAVGPIVDILPQEVRDVLDPMRDFAASVGVDDTVRFTALRTSYPYTDFDLLGKTYQVSAIPSGPFHNGYFIVPGAGDKGGPVRYPQRHTVNIDRGWLVTGDRGNGWPQNAGFDYLNTVYPVWKEGAGHEAADTHVRRARSFTRGKMWERYERLFQSAVGARSCWAADAVGGGLAIMAVREHAGPHKDGAILGTRLWAGRLGERREHKDTVPGGTGTFATMSILATNGSATYRVKNCPRHGLRTGCVVNITNVGATVGGRTVSGDYTVTGKAADWWEFVHPSGVALSTEEIASDFDLEFREEEVLRELTVAGTTLSEAVRAFAGSPYAGTVQFYFHCMRDNPDDPNGGFWIGVTGGGVGPHMAYITNCYYSTATITKLVQINSSSARGEPSFTVMDDGTIFGAMRTNDEISSGGIFWSLDSGSTFTVRLNEPGVGNNFRYSPVAVDHIEDEVFILQTGNRVRGTPGTQTAGDVDVFLRHGLITDIIGAGAEEGIAALTVDKVGETYFANESHGDTGNWVGVVDMVASEGKLHCFIATETAENVGRVMAPSYIQHWIIDWLKPPAKLPDTNKDFNARGFRNKQEAGRFLGYGAAHVIFELTGVGAIVGGFGHGFTVTNPASGRLDIKLNTNPGHRQWFILPMANGASTKSYSGLHMADDTFSVRLSGGVNAPIFGAMFMNYQWTRTDWQGDV